MCGGGRVRVIGGGFAGRTSASARTGRKPRGQTDPSTRRWKTGRFRERACAPWDGFVSPQVFADGRRGGMTRKRRISAGGAGHVRAGDWRRTRGEDKRERSDGAKTWGQTDPSTRRWETGRFRERVCAPWDGFVSPQVFADGRRGGMTRKRRISTGGAGHVRAGDWRRTRGEDGCERSDGAKTSGTDGSVHAAMGDGALSREGVRALGRIRQSPGFRGWAARWDDAEGKNLDGRRGTRAGG